MARRCSALFLVAALCFEGVAAADEPPDPGPEVEPGATVAPGATIPAAPEPPAVAAPLLPQRAPAQPVVTDPEPPTLSLRNPRFGDAGQIALNGALSASIGHLGYDVGDSSGTSVSIEPAFDYFAVPSFSQGAAAFARYSTGTSGNGVDVTSKTLGLTLRVGTNFWLGGRFSFWPKLAVGGWRNWLDYSAPSPGYTVTIDGITIPVGPSSHFKENTFFIEVQAPFLLHLAQHFFVGFGPNAYVDVAHSIDSKSSRRRFVGASSTIGGWF